MIYSCLAIANHVQAYYSAPTNFIYLFSCPPKFRAAFTELPDFDVCKSQPHHADKTEFITASPAIIWKNLGQTALSLGSSPGYQIQCIFLSYRFPLDPKEPVTLLTLHWKPLDPAAWFTRSKALACTAARSRGFLRSCGTEEVTAGLRRGGRQRGRRSTQPERDRHCRPSLRAPSQHS